MWKIFKPNSPALVPKPAQYYLVQPEYIFRGTRARLIFIHANFLRMPTLHGLLPLAGAGAFVGGGNHPTRCIQGPERTRFHPAIHAADLGSRRLGLAGKARWRLYFSGRRRLFRASRQAATMPRFSEPVEFPPALRKPATPSRAKSARRNTSAASRSSNPRGTTDETRLTRHLKFQAKAQKPPDFHRVAFN